MVRTTSSSDDTRAALVRAARRLFARGGQRKVAVLAVSKAAKVTTGALYHHFRDRDALLRAVLEDVAGWVAEQALLSMGTLEDPWERLRVGVSSVLDSCLVDDVRYAYNEAPAIVGLDEWRSIEEARTGALLLEGLRQVAATGSLKPVSLELLAAMVKGALVEAAMAITRSDDPKRARVEAGALAEELLSALRQPVSRS